MEIKKNRLLHRIRSLAEKHGNLKYAVFAVCIGIVILLLPTEREAVPAAATEIAAQKLTQEPSVEERISEILSKMVGAGRVEVMLTVKNDGEIIYQTDLEESRTESSAETRVQTVFANTSGKDGALIRQKNAPMYLGAVVLAQGGDSAEVQYRLKLAVSSLTGLGTDKITVLKMKSQ